MRHILFILLLLPIVLFAQTDWSKSPYDNSSATSVKESVRGEESEEMQETPEKEVRLIYSLDKGFFSTGLFNSKIHMLDADTLRYDQFESLSADFPKVREELSSTKHWSIAAIAFAITTIVGLNVWAYGSGDAASIGGYATLGGLLLEGFCVRQSNNHYNAAIDLYNERMRGY